MATSTAPTGIFSVFPPPRYLDAPVAGLDISSEAVRVVLLGKSKVGLVPRHFEERKLAMHLGSERPIEHAELVSTLRDLAQKHKLSSVRVSLPEEKAYIFTTELSREALGDARTAVGFKIEENVPINPSNAVYDYVVIDGGSDASDAVTVSVTVVPLDVVMGYLELLEVVGLSCAGFVTQSQALARAAVIDSDCGSFLLVNAHDGDTDIAVVRGHAVQYSSTVYSTGSDVVDRIQKVLTFWQGRIKAHTGEVMPSRLLLAGSQAEDGDLKDALLKQVPLPVSRANVWANCFSFDDYVPAVPREAALSYGVAIGCALPDRLNRC
jgi:Tfp pilus assembly PilM family ATPase